MLFVFLRYWNSGFDIRVFNHFYFFIHTFIMKSRIQVFPSLKKTKLQKGPFLLVTVSAQAG